MPQTSLSEWLSKPSSLQQRAAVKTKSTETVVDDRICTVGTPAVPNSSLVSLKADDSVHDKTEAKPGRIIERKQRSLPANVELRACTKEDIPHLKRLTSLLLPIPYPEKFYREIIEDRLTSNITIVAVWHDDPKTVGMERGRLVGAIRCRLLAHPPRSNPSLPAKIDGPMLYISTLVLLSPYRSHGIAKKMLDVLTKRAINDYGVTSIGAHVWAANVEGLEWYRKRDFWKVGEDDGYYRRLKPQGAIVMQRGVGVMDLVGK